MMNWYLVVTKPREEDKVERQLASASIECLSPKLNKKSLRMNKVVSIVEPLFPRYIFVRTELEKNYRIVKYTRGVIGFVEFGTGPVRVEDSIVDEITGRIKDGYIEIIDKREGFKKNEKLKIKRGILKDLDVLFDGYLSGEERVSLLLENVSSNIKININRIYL